MIRSIYESKFRVMRIPTKQHVFQVTLPVEFATSYSILCDVYDVYASRRHISKHELLGEMFYFFFIETLECTHTKLNPIALCALESL